MRWASEKRDENRVLGEEKFITRFFFFIIMFVLKGVRSTLGNGTSKDAEDTGKIIKEWSRTQEGVRGRAQ